MSDENIIVTYPKIMATVGIIADILFVIVIIGVTFSQQISNTISALIFYFVLGLCFYGGLYLILKSVKCKVICQNKKITVFTIFNKPYTFLVEDIVSVMREKKITYYGERERLVIKNNKGKKIIVESSQTSYEKFLKFLELTVKIEEPKGDSSCGLTN